VDLVISTHPADHAESATLDRAAAALAAAKEHLVPLALDAKDRLVPLAVDAKDRLVPFAVDAKDRLIPLAVDAKDRLIPLAVDAKDRFVPLVQEAAAKARPAMATAITRVTEVVDTEVKPRLSDLLEEAQADPHVAVAAQRGRAAVAALKGDLSLPVEVIAAPAKRCHPVLKTLLLAALVGGIAYLVKTLLGPRDDGWELIDEAAPEAAPAPAEAPAPAPAPAAAEVAEPAPAPAEPAEAARVYGEGAYVGPNPPEGYVIKGNEQSMKYHVPGALAYNRCVPEVWFNSPEAAERAGFTRAAR